MRKKWIGAFAVMGLLIVAFFYYRYYLVLCAQTDRITLPSNAYVEEWDLIMEITDGEAKEEQTLQGVASDASAESTPSALKNNLDSMESIQNILVAVIDTGLDYEDFAEKDRVVDIGLWPDSLADENGHGTLMAEIIAQNSGERVKIMPIRVTDAYGRTTVAKVCQAILDAKGNGADIINISMNTLDSAKSNLLELVISQAVADGTMVVASAGNKGTDVKNIAPANVEQAVVISAVNPDGTFASYSNYGDTVDYSALGDYRGHTGTSYAAAYYSGVLAELLSKGENPASLDSYVEDFGEAGWDPYYGKGAVTLAQFSGGTFVEEMFGDNWEEISDSVILNMGDFHLLTDAKIDDCIRRSDLADVGYYLSSLSESEREELLARDTMLSGTVSFCAGDFAGAVSDTGGAVSLTEKEECLFYEKCLAVYAEESSVMRTSAAYLHATGYFYLAFVDDAGLGLSTKYQICARVSYKKGGTTVGGETANQLVQTLGNQPYSITVWSVVCTGASDTMQLQWDGSLGYYARFLPDDKGKNGSIFVPMIRVACPAYTLMYKADMVHAAGGTNCAGRGNFFEYSSGNIYTYTADPNRFQLRKYGMQTTATSQLIAPQINASHMNLASTAQSYAASVSTHCTMYVHLNRPSVSLTINPNGEKWAGTSEAATLTVVNTQSVNLGTPSVTNYRATFYGGGDVLDPVTDISITTDREFAGWKLDCAANGTGAHGTYHSFMKGTAFVAGNMEYDQRNSSRATVGEIVTATALFSGSLSVVFPKAPERPGYTFLGWYTGAESGTGVLACSSTQVLTASVTLTEDTQFHAEWVKNDYSVSFYSDGQQLDVKSYPYRTTVDLSKSDSFPVEKNGYVLVGWSLAEKGSAAASVTVPANNDMRLYAVWSRPTSGMKQVVLSVESGSNRGYAVVGTTGTATVNAMLGLRAYLYQTDIPLVVTEQGIRIAEGGNSYAEDNAGNKTPLSGTAAASQLPVLYTFVCKYYIYRASTGCWEYLENMDTQEFAEVYAGDTYTYTYSREQLCDAPEGYVYDHAEYGGREVELPYTVEFTGAGEADETVFTTDIFFYPTVCTVTFDANGGTFPADGLGDAFQVLGDGSTASRAVLYGSCIGSFPGADRGSFYGCTGYFDERDGGMELHAYDTVKGDLLVYAQWEVKSCTVRYDAGSNGGTVSGESCLETLVPYADEVSYGDYQGKREQYEFLGWSMEAQNMPSSREVKTLQTESDAVWVQSEAMTLYAQFARTLHILFYQWDFVEEGIAEDGANPVLYNQQTEAVVVSPALSTYEGWEPCGWIRGTNASKSYEIGGQTAFTVEDDDAFYALYRRTVTVAYETGIYEEADGILFAEADMEFAYRCTGGGDDLLAEFVIREAPNRQYYEFVCWKSSDGEQYQPGDSYTSVDDLALEAVWKPVEATVIFDAGRNGGTVNGMEEIAVSIAYGSEIPAGTSKMPAVRAGYEFLGWNTDPDAQRGLLVNPSVDSTVVDDGVMTLYAVFSREVRAVFYQQDETAVVTVEGTLYNNAEYVTVHAPAVGDFAGWSVRGWTTAQEAYADVELSSDTDFGLSEDVSFYALYEKNVTLSYDTGIQSVRLASRSGVVYHNTYDRTTKSDEPARFTVSGMTAQERRSFLYWVDDGGMMYSGGSEIAVFDDELLTAVWDEVPEITAMDRYFTLEQAIDPEGAYINREALLDAAYVAASDREDGSLTVRLLGFYQEEFQALTGTADLMVYYETADSYGHTVTESAVVHVVDTGGKEELFAKNIRFFSSAYDREGESYVPEEMGGLSSASLWRTDPAYAECLSEALKNADAEEHSIRYYSHFTMEEVKRIQELSAS